EVALLDVDLEPNRVGVYAALEGVQLGADEEGLDRGSVAAQLAREFGIALARGEAHAGEDAARLLHADRFDQLLAQRRQRGGVEQHHALFPEPDQAVVGREAQHLAQVRTRRIVNAAQDRSPPYPVYVRVVRVSGCGRTRTDDARATPASYRPARACGEPCRIAIISRFLIDSSILLDSPSGPRHSHRLTGHPRGSGQNHENEAHG